MKPIFSIYLDFWCGGVDCVLMDCDHHEVLDGSQFAIRFGRSDATCEVCWLRWKNPTHITHMSTNDHKPTGPKEWPWH